MLGATGADAPPPGFVLLDWRRGFGLQIGPLYEKRDADGRLIHGFRVGEHHTNGLGNAHGGMMMTFADLAWGRIVSAERPVWWVTARLSCEFLSGAKMGEWIEGGGRLVGEADDLFTVEGRIWCGERLLVTGIGLFKAVGRRG